MNSIGKNKSALLIDGNNIAYRSFFAIPDLMTSSNVPTNAIYGFLSMLLRVQQTWNPCYIAVCFDSKEKTFRSLDFDPYKAQRKPMPDPLIAQMKIIKEEILRQLGVPYFEKPGFEADDFIATFTKHFQAQNIEVIILSGDRDMLQLVKNGKVTVSSPMSGGKDNKLFTEEAISRDYGITPLMMVDYKALVGDSSDNIQGAMGVGPKTAVRLLQKFGSIENMFADTTKETEKIRNQKEIVLLNQQLIQLNADVPIDLQTDSLLAKPWDMDVLMGIIHKYELRSLIKRVSPSSNVQKIVSEPIGIKSDIKWEHILRQAQVAVGTKEGGHIILYDGTSHFEFSLANSSLFSENVNRESFLKLLESESIRKILFDGKKLLHILEPPSSFQWKKVYDIQLFWYLWKPNAKNYEETDFREEFGDHDQEPTQIFWDSCPTLEKELTDLKLLALYQEIELPLLYVLYKMEAKGIMVSRSTLSSLQQKLGTSLVSLQQEINSVAGTEINILSPKQLSFFLFDKLGLPSQKKTKTGYSTDADVLASLVGTNPVVPKIMQFKELSKIQNTYVESYLKLSQTRSMLHTTYLQAGPATGRISSVNPNLQNIPMDNEWGKEVRKAIIPRTGSYVFLSADYSQIDLRVMAHYSKDLKLREAFLANEDVHSRTARILFHIPEGNLVEDRMRNIAKTVNFGVLYGMTSHGLSESLKISEKEAREFIERYYSTFFGVKEWIEKTIQEATKMGYVTTLLGRRRPIPELRSSNKMIHQLGERLAVNTIIQGTSADIIKKAMLSIDSQLRKTQSFMVLQIHDELILEVPIDELQKVTDLVKTDMEQSLSLEVPLRVHLSSGKTLADLT